MRLDLNQKFDFRFIGVFLVTVFSGAYMTKLVVSPIYPFMGLGIILIMFLALTGRLSSPLSKWFVLLLAIGIFSLFVIRQIVEQSTFQNVASFVLGPVAFISIIIAGAKLPRHDLGKISKAYVYLSVAIACVEASYRLSHPDFSFLDGAESRNVDIDEVAFYAYKFNSLMYLDSNFVGLQLAIVFAFVIALLSYDIKFKPIIYLSLIVLIFLSLSRASIFAALGVGSFYLLRRMNRFLRAIALVLCLLIACGIFLYVQNDGSFLTKLAILEIFGNYLKTASTENILLGVGVGRASDVLGMGAHNIWVTYLVEVGALMSGFILLFWLFMARSVPGIIFLVIAWFVNGFSLTSLAIPYMYGSAAILWCLMYHRNEKNLKYPKELTRLSHQ